MGEIELNKKIRNFLNSALKSIETRDYTRAIKELIEAEKMDKKNPEILYNIGICLCKLENFENAIIYFKKVLSLPFKFVDIITVNKLLSYSLIKLEDIKNATKYIEDILHLVPNDTVLLNMLGYCYEKQRNFKDAISIFNRITEIDKKNYNAYNSLSYIMGITDKDLDKALGYAKLAYESDNDNPAYLDTIGYIYIKKGNPEMAKKFLKKALAKCPESEEIKGHLNELLKI